MFKKAIALLLLIVAVYWSFFALLPSKITDFDADKNEFSTARALVHLEKISKKTHPVGSEAHAEVRNYIVNALKDLGLEPTIQEGYTISRWGNLVKPKNILARIPGSDNSKALLLLSHYDSSPHSSFGASDAGSGVVTILEGLRAFLNENKTPKNDIIVLITDSEELGLNGADLFVNKHPWAKDVGLVLNFEARGSGGPGYMLIETNGGNANLMKEYVEANPQFPVGNSLAYSIYKMLPNDTDLTRFRVDGDIDGFNFAFIDDHFDYHTANDTYERLDRNTLQHQGSYLMPLLHHFSDADLTDLKSNEDYIYFNIPMFKTIIYPYGWIWPMIVLAILSFGALIFIGFSTRRLNKDDVLKGFIPFLGGAILSTLLGYVMWMFISWMYPHYGEMLHGFTYNGHTYIFAFVFLSLGVCFWIYSKYYKPGNTASLLIAPITIWILLCIVIAVALKGASFFIVPVFFALLALFVLIKQRKPSLILTAILCFPLLLIMSPFLKMFPVGLGLKILFVCCLLVALMFGLTIPVFGFFRHKKRWSFAMFFIAVCLLLSAHFKSSFNEERQKPNSLVYVLDADENKAMWSTYDNVLDSWTQNFITKDSNSVEKTSNDVIASKYSTRFTYTADAPVKALVYPEVEVFRDTIIGEFRHLSVYIASKRQANRIDLFANSQYIFKDFNINGVDAYKLNESSYAFENRYNNRLFSYYVVDNEPLELVFTVPKDQKTKLTLYESSNDLLENRLFTVPERSDYMIPKPFVLNDAIIITKEILID